MELIRSAVNSAELVELQQKFNEHFEEDGNEYLYPIQDADEAKDKIGGGNLYRALLVLIASISEYHGDEIWCEGIGQRTRLQEEGLTERAWGEEVAIGSTILSRVPNEEDLETLINHNEALIAEIIAAAIEYEEGFAFAEGRG